RAPAAAEEQWWSVNSPPCPCRSGGKEGLGVERGLLHQRQRLLVQAGHTKLSSDRCSLSEHRLRLRALLLVRVVEQERRVGALGAREPGARGHALVQGEGGLEVRGGAIAVAGGLGEQAEVVVARAHA